MLFFKVEDLAIMASEETLGRVSLIIHIFLQDFGYLEHVPALVLTYCYLLVRFPERDDGQVVFRVTGLRFTLGSTTEFQTQILASEKLFVILMGLLDFKCIYRCELWRFLFVVVLQLLRFFLIKRLCVIRLHYSRFIFEFEPLLDGNVIAWSIWIYHTLEEAGVTVESELLATEVVSVVRG